MTGLRFRRRSILSLMRVQVIALLLIVATVSGVFLAFYGNSPDIPMLTLSTAIACCFASLLCVFLVRNFIHYPGKEQAAYIIVAVCLAYALLFSGLVMFRINYSRTLLAGTFLVSVMFLLLYHEIARRRTGFVIGIVPNADFQQLTDIPGIEWRLLEHPTAIPEDIDAITVDLWSDVSDDWERQLASCALGGVPVLHSKHLYESLTGRVEIEHLSENHFGTLSPLYGYMGVKQLVDWVAALIFLILLLPALLVVAVMIRLDSPGPILFRQRRIGYCGTPFLVFKFRTMTDVPHTVEGEMRARDAAMTKSDDKRVTRFGRFLRRSRIDELPQLLNVLRGEMSWIGPRPEAEILSRWYENEIPFYRYRHIVRPGITGWAQVQQGHVADVEQVRTKLHYDFYYIKNFSPWLDAIIVFRTIWTMSTGFGSR